jgi:lipoprotein-anchoring transpeptidase ErfK/SrfK
VFACSLVAASAAGAQTQWNTWHKPRTETEHAAKEPFGAIPKGPVQIIISVDQQMLHVYSDGTHVTDTLIATGVPAHPTPFGVFNVIQKSLLHHSNIYSGAPMPYMQRITWSGVAMHEGVNLGHPASHGCIRMSHDFATRLWVLTRLGARVIIAGPELRPEDFSDPRLFVHKDPALAAASVASATVPAPAKVLRTAQTADEGKTTDAPGQATEDAKSTDTPASRAAGDPTRPANAALDKPAQPATARKQVASAAAEPKLLTVVGTDQADAAPAAGPDRVPMPWPRPIEIEHASKSPISIFVSHKEKKIYVRQDFLPLFDAPIVIENPEIGLGTHVFTALEYSADRLSFRWNVVSLPGESPPAQPISEMEKRPAMGARNEEHAANNSFAEPPPPPQTPQQALARIELPPDAIERISQLIVPGSSLIISDYGLGEETGEGTDFIVVFPGDSRFAVNNDRKSARASRSLPARAYWPERQWR